MKCDLVIGGQFGSEGKGVVAHHMATRRHYNAHVRVGGANAGHCIVHQGRLYKMQMIPCGWCDGPNSLLVFGPGAIIDLPILMREIQETGIDPQRICIDFQAAIAQSWHDEGGVNGSMHARIGSTGKGVGMVRIDKLKRDPAHCKLAKDCIPELPGFLCDTTLLLSKLKYVLLEGTQGYGLGLNGAHWPYCTSADCTAAQLVNDCGVPMHSVRDIAIVFRSMPIRVAGNSGKLQGETSFEMIGVAPERTTVTNKVRRIGTWDQELFEAACRVNGPTFAVLTFADYVDAENAGNAKSLDDMSIEFRDFIAKLENFVPVPLIGTGFDPEKGWKSIGEIP